MGNVPLATSATSVAERKPFVRSALLNSMDAIPMINAARSAVVNVPCTKHTSARITIVAAVMIAVGRSRAGDAPPSGASGSAVGGRRGRRERGARAIDLGPGGRVTGGTAAAPAAARGGRGTGGRGAR